MRLTNRVHRLEAASGVGICRECAGKGILCVSHHAEGEPEPVPKGCPSCGAAYHVVINTLVEEYYWRWFFFSRLRAFMPSTPAILLASLAFTLHHSFAFWWNGGTGGALVAGIVAVTLAGAVWARLYERGRGIFAPWISHMITEIALLTIAYDLWRA